MSHYQNLPVYNDIFFLLKDLYKRIPNFSKQYKYFLGGEILRINVFLIDLVYQISCQKNNSERLKLVTELQRNAEMLSLHIRIAQELNLWGG